MSVKIPLSQGLFAIIDDEDAARVNHYKWSALKGRAGYYAVHHIYKKGSNGKTEQYIYLHRFLTNAPQGKVVDHINRDTLDNRRANLRVCMNRENLKNRGAQKNNPHGLKGAYWNGKWWVSAITSNGIRHYLGRFESKMDAARAYNDAALRLNGEFATLNEI